MPTNANRRACDAAAGTLQTSTADTNNQIAPTKQAPLQVTLARPHLDGLPDPVAVFTARSEARALLYAAGEFDLIEAVDGPQASAVTSGLIDKIGQDVAQAITAQAFAPIREHDWYIDAEVAAKLERHYEDQHRDLIEYLDTADLSETFAASCKLADEQHARKQQRQAGSRRCRLGTSISTLRTARYLIKQNDLDRFLRWLNEHSAEQRAAILTHIKSNRGA